jgi:hypothetical protein
MLTFLQDMQDPEKLRAFPLWRAHQITGDRKGVWSLNVTPMKTIIEEKAMRMLNPVHPGRFLRSEVIEAHELSVAGAARILGVSAQRFPVS